MFLRKTVEILLGWILWARINLMKDNMSVKCAKPNELPCWYKRKGQLPMYVTTAAQYKCSGVTSYSPSIP